MCSGSPLPDRDPKLRRHYSPKDPGGRGNGQHEPNRPWWTLDLTPRWARLTLAGLIVTFSLAFPAGCADPPDDDDLPGQVDTSLDGDRCGEVDDTRCQP